MKERTQKWIAAALVLLSATLVYAHIGRQTISGTLTIDGVYQGASTGDLTAPYPGQLFVDWGDSSTSPELYVHDQSANSTDFALIPNDDSAVTWSGSQTFSGAVLRNRFREDFDSWGWTSFQDDGTTVLTANASSNVTLIVSYDNDNLGMIGYTIDGDNLAGAIAPMATSGYFSTVLHVDDIADEGVEFCFGCLGNDATSIVYEVSAGPTFLSQTDSEMYCEARIDITNISAVDDWWFGWVLNDAADTNPASADFDTAAVFTLIDNTGDINFTTMIDNGAETSDDSAVDWTDNDQFVLRVSISDSAVTFKGDLTNNGTAVAALSAQSTAVLDLLTTDLMQCRLGWTASASEDLGLTIDYVEIGFE